MEHLNHRADEQLIKTRLLPSSPSTVYSAGIDLQGAASLKEDFCVDAELQINAPLLTVGQLGNTYTVTYKVQTSADDSTYADLFSSVLVQTGSGGAGAAAVETIVPIRGRINGTSGNLRRYIRLAVTSGTSAGDCSAATATATLRL